MKKTKDIDNVAATSAATVTRRDFLKQGSGVIGLAVVPGSTLVATAVPTSAYAAGFANLGGSVGRTLMRMARDIYPHDKLDDKYYATVVGPYDEKATKDAAFHALISNGVAMLDQAAIKRFGKSYADLSSEGDRVHLLYGIEQTPFFQKVRGDLLYGIYNNKEVWPIFGYEGSSWEKGGYIKRGFNDIKWL